MSRKNQGQIPFLLVLIGLAVVGAVIFVAIQGLEPGSGSGEQDEPAAEAENIETAPFEGGGAIRTEVSPTVPTASGNGSARSGEVQSSATVRGSVVALGSAPVPEARVVLSEKRADGTGFWDPGGNPLRRLSTRTGASGEFAFERLPVGTDFEMWVHHPDYAPKAGPSVTVLPTEDQVLPAVELSAGYSLHGTVTDTAGNPLAARLVARLQPTHFEPNADALADLEVEQQKRVIVQADANGVYQIDRLAKGIWSLRASYEGFASALETPIPLMNDEVSFERNVQLGTEFVMQGVVLDADRTPVAGADIAVSRSRPRPLFHESTISGPDGRFELRGLPEGVYGVSATAEGFSRKNVPRVQSPAEELEIILEKRGGVTGRVTGPDGRALTSFTLEALQVNNVNTMYGRIGTQLPIQDPNGNYSYQDLEPGTYVLLARADGYSPTYSPGFRVDRDVVVGVDFSLKVGARLEGTVSGADGRALAGAEVVLRGKDYTPDRAFGLFGATAPDPNNVPQVVAKTDSNGRWVMENSYVATLQIEVRHGSYLSEFVQVDVPEGGNVNVGDVTLRQGGTVYGSAVDGASVPLSGGTAYLTMQNEGGFGHFARNRLLDASGRFRFEGLKPGTYRISAASAEGGGFLFLAEAENSTQTIYVGEGSEVEVNLTVQQ